MNTQDKSLNLAALMGWKVSKQYGDQCLLMPSTEQLHMTIYEPYSDTLHGRAQFAAILLKFPEVMQSFALDPTGYRCIDEPTQGNILDVILEMKGVEI